MSTVPADVYTDNITDVVNVLALGVVVLVMVVVVLLQKLGPANTLHFVVRDVKKVSLCFFCLHICLMMSQTDPSQC